HRGEDRCVLVYDAELKRDRIFKIGVATAFSDTRSVASYRDRAAQDQINGLHFPDCHLATEFERAFDAGRGVDLLAKALRIELDEALLFAKPRHRHVNCFSLL